MTTADTPSSSGSETTSQHHHPPGSSPSLTGEERLLVAVRIRPLDTNEGPRVLHAFTAKDIVLEDCDKRDHHHHHSSRRSYDKQYSFDLVFREDSTQEAVYRATTSNLVRDVLNGYNATVFSYGVTGAGKTYTMVGDSNEPGIMVRALNDLFKVVRENQEIYTVTLSYLEVYNEQIRDLLNPSSGYLELREDSRGRSTHVPGLKQVPITSTSEIMHLLQKGNRARSTEPTASNLTSSRSHALLSVTVRCRQTLTKTLQGRLCMIDLAGSERATRTHNHGKRLVEGSHINRSLLALGNCINALSGGARYVNYRDSKLTRLLKDTLGGNCRTVMIAHVSPGALHREESRNTLIYAERAASIVTKVERNLLDVGYHVSQYQTVISELKEEIGRLRQKMMSEERPRSGAALKLRERSSSEVRSIRARIVDTFRQQMKLRRKLMEVDSHLLGIGMEAERQHLIISHWESRKNKLYKSSPSEQQRSKTQQTASRAQMNDGSKSAPSAEDVTAESEEAIAIKEAWQELNELERDQERLAEKRAGIETKLEVCRLQGVTLEDKLPTLMSSDDEREILALICRVHELEADKMALQSERLVRQHELRRRDLLILRYDRQRQLAEEIITKQRHLIDGANLMISSDLQDLYQMYQQEIQADSYADTNPHTVLATKLPSISKIYGEPIFQRSEHHVTDSSNGDPSMLSESSSDSNESTTSEIPPLPTLTHPSVDRIMGQAVSRFGTRLPQLSSTCHERCTGRK